MKFFKKSFFGIALLALCSCFTFAHAQYIVYQMEFDVALTNKNLDGNLSPVRSNSGVSDQAINYWKSGGISMNYSQRWHSLDGGVTVAPAGPAYVLMSNPTSVVNRPGGQSSSGTSQCGSSTVYVCAHVVSGSTKGVANSSATWQDGLEAFNATLISAVMDTSGPEPFFKTIKFSTDFLNPDASNPSATVFTITGTSDTSASVIQETTGYGQSFNTTNVSQGYVTAPITYGGAITTGYYTIVAPEMDVGLWPQISLLILNLFFVMRKRRVV